MDEFGADDRWRRREGRRTVFGAALGMGTGYGLLMVTAGLFIAPMQQSFGWSRADLTFVPIIGIISALFMPLTGWAIDRWGARTIGLTGLAALALGYTALALLPPNKLLFYGLLAFIGMIASASSPMPWTRGVAGWFVRRRGTALGIAMCGTSIISALLLPILSTLIASQGWRSGYILLLAVVCAAGMPSVFFLFREAPREPRAREEHVNAPGFGLIFREPRFWLLSACFALVSLPIGGFMAHLVPILVDRGLATTDAALVGSAFALSIAVGRVLSGVMLDRVWPPLVASACFLLPIFGAQMLPLISEHASAKLAMAVLAASLLGFAQGAEGDFIAFFSARYFPLPIYARVYAMVAMVVYLGMAAGGLYFARIYDAEGNYDHVVAFGSVCYLAGGIGILFLDILRRQAKGIAVRISASAELTDA